MLIASHVNNVHTNTPKFYVYMYIAFPVVYDFYATFSAEWHKLF